MSRGVRLSTPHDSVCCAPDRRPAHRPESKAEITTIRSQFAAKLQQIGRPSEIVGYCPDARGGKTRKSAGELAEKLSAVMSVRGWKTASDVAHACGLDRTLVGKYLKGKTLPGWDNLKAIAVACQVTTDYLVGRTVYREKTVDEILRLESLEVFFQEADLAEDARSLLRRLAENPSAPNSVDNWRMVSELVPEALRLAEERRPGRTTISPFGR